MFDQESVGVSPHSAETIEAMAQELAKQVGALLDGHESVVAVVALAKLFAASIYMNREWCTFDSGMDIFSEMVAANLYEMKRNDLSTH